MIGEVKTPAVETLVAESTEREHELTVPFGTHKMR
jgi:hypothetical protein